MQSDYELLCGRQRQRHGRRTARPHPLERARHAGRLGLKLGVGEGAVGTLDRDAVGVLGRRHVKPERHA